MAKAAQILSIAELKKKHGKRFSKAAEKIRSFDKAYFSIDEAIKAILETPAPKFDESLHVALRLGVDPKHSDQMVRGAVVLPHGTGKSATVVVFAKGEKIKEAEEAGALEVGGEELAQKILGGWTDFTSVVATPDMMPIVSKVARVLGPKGLMPNPKLGTVTMDLKSVIGELKKGRVEFRAEKAGIVHAPIGKRSLGAEKLLENLNTLLETVVRLKPSASKGSYILSAYLSAAMGPSLMLDHQAILSTFSK